MKKVFYNAQFELNSLLGRKLFNRKLVLNKGENLLHLGCSTNVFNGWINADFFPNYLRPRFWRNFKKRTVQWYLDLRYPLKCKNNIFDGVFTEHTFEHILPEHVGKLLSGLFMAMKPGSVIRIIVPDLETYVDFYTGKKFMKNITLNLIMDVLPLEALHRIMNIYQPGISHKRKNILKIIDL